MKKSIKLIAVTAALALLMLCGCQTEIPMDFLSDTDMFTHIPVTDSDLISQLGEQCSGLFSTADMPAFYSEGYDFAGCTLCNVYTCESGGKSEKIAMPADNAYTCYFEKNGEWCERIYEDGGSSVDIAVAPMPDYPSAVAAYEEKSAYSKLTDFQKEVYDDIFGSVKSLTPFSYNAEGMTEEQTADIKTAVGAMVSDNLDMLNYFDLVTLPEGGVAAQYHLPDGEITSDSDAVSAANKEFEAACDSIISQMPSGLSAYGKYLYLAQRLSLCSEPIDSVQHTAPYNAVITGDAASDDYAAAYEILCRKAGLYCKVVTGKVNGKEGKWNTIAIEEGTYHHADIACADLNGSLGDDSWMAYFALTDEEVSFDHSVAD